MKVTIVLLISILQAVCGFAQQAPDFTVYDKLDTVAIHFSAPTFDTANEGANRYYLNNQRVDKRTSDEAQRNGNLISNCRPCVLKTYNQYGIIFEGVQSGDGRTGYWIEYYPNTGRVKTRGRHKKMPGGICYDATCSIKEGEWEYYNVKGRLIKREIYKNGKLTHTVKL
ncbi:MAG: hypothetical protein H7Y86_10885 [Rhizobacter sp.]|nr:hypothetical protein [Ferruginibacter sp.]